MIVEKNTTILLTKRLYFVQIIEICEKNENDLTIAVIETTIETTT